MSHLKVKELRDKIYFASNSKAFFGLHIK